MNTEKNLIYELLFYSLDERKYDKIINKVCQLSDIEWNKFINLLNAHGIICCFYRNIKLNKLDNMIPANILGILHKVYISSTIRNLKIFNALSKVLNVFNNNDIQVIVLKGAALAEIIYKDIALRPMMDVDLFIERKNIWKSDKILSGMGYESDINNFVSKHHISTAHNIHYTSSDLSIDLHPTIHNFPGVNPWERAKKVKLANIDTLILNAEEFLLHICLHLNSHLCRNQTFRLIWWCDIAFLIKHYQNSLDWDYLLRLSKINNFNKALTPILYTTNKWFELDIPNNVFVQLDKYIKTIPFYELLDYEQKNISSHQKQNEDQQIRSLLLNISEMPSFYDKLRFIFNLVFPCRNFIKSRYVLGQRKFYYHYYFIYIIDLIKSAIKGLPRYVKVKHTSLKELSTKD